MLFFFLGSEKRWWTWCFWSGFCFSPGIFLGRRYWCSRSPLPVLGIGELYFFTPFKLGGTCFSHKMQAEVTSITYRWMYLIARSPVSHPFSSCLGGRECLSYVICECGGASRQCGMECSTSSQRHCPEESRGPAVEGVSENLTRSVKSWDSGLISYRR